MKKLKLKALELGMGEVLKRDQLRNVIGGNGNGDGDTGKICNIKCISMDPDDHGFFYATYGSSCSSVADCIVTCDPGFYLEAYCG